MNDSSLHPPRSLRLCVKSASGEAHAKHAEFYFMKTFSFHPPRPLRLCVKPTLL